LALDSIPSLEVLNSHEVNHIAIANPTIAPYGQATIEVLENIGALHAVESKLVYGESLAQTNQFIISRAATIGFTSMSTVLAVPPDLTGNWAAVDRSLYTPIKQGIVLLGDSPSAKSHAFHKFIFSPRARSILKENGYALTDE
jgi:molybdate transport system substrate-binding protein